MPIGVLDKNEILDYLSQIKPELEEIGIVELGLFGSYAKDKANIASDIDITLKTTEKFRNLYNGINALIVLDQLRENFMKQFKRSVDICNTASMTKAEKERVLTGVIYV